MSSSRIHAAINRQYQQTYNVISDLSATSRSSLPNQDGGMQILTKGGRHPGLQATRRSNRRAAHQGWPAGCAPAYSWPA